MNMNPMEILQAYSPKPAPTVAGSFGGASLSMARNSALSSMFRAPVAPVSAAPVPPSAPSFPEMPVRSIRAVEPKSSGPSKMLLFGGLGLVAVAAVAVVVLKKKRG